MDIIIDEAIVGAVGAFLLVLGIGKKDERKKLISNGIRVPGVVHQMDYSGGNSSSCYPVIRFVTLEAEWITETYRVDPGLASYEEGDNVNVIYDPADHKHFVLDDTSTKLLGPVYIAGGAALIIGALVYYLLHPDQT